MPDSSTATGPHTEAHNPALLHHFADPQQQRDAASLGMWVFLATEVMFFGGLFCAYLVYRLKYFGDFGAASKTLNRRPRRHQYRRSDLQQLNRGPGSWAAQTARRTLLIASLILTMLLGLVFLGIKAVEYTDKFEEHHVPGASFSFEKVPIPGHPGEYANPRHAQLFFSLYFVMTGLHALHMIIGLGIFSLALNHGLERPFHPRVAHSSRDRRPLLALRRYHLDLPVSVALPDRPAPVKLACLRLNYV